MIKLPGKRPREQVDAETARRSNQGISVSGHALRNSLLLGMALLLIPMLLLSGWHILIYAPQQRSALFQRVADSQAEQIAASLAAGMQGLRERLAHSATLSDLVIPRDAASVDDLALAETALRQGFPEAQSVRLLPLGVLGIAHPSSGIAELRNHIEIDLVQHAADDGQAGPEAYRVAGEWLVSLAQRIKIGSEADAPQAVLLLSLDEPALRALLPAAEGQLALQQRFADRATIVLREGTGTESPTQGQAVVPLSSWQVLYQPGAGLTAALERATRPAYEIALGAIVLGTLGFLISLWRGSRVLRREVSRIRDAAESRIPLTLRVPHLLPLARELRKITLRQSRPAGGMPTAIAPLRSSAPDISAVGVDGGTERALSRTIFRAYDIRGVADDQLDDDTVFRIGSAVAVLATDADEQTVVLACDGRNSSPRIKAVLEKALLRAGRDVVDIGLVPTPLLYFATQRADCSSGIMVTGSHNPADCNGMKIVLKRRTVAAGTIARLRDIAESGSFPAGNGRSLQRDVVGDYLDELSNDIAIAVPLKIVIDAGNGATAHVAPALLEELGCEVVPLYCDIDGDFPNRSPDTGNENNLRPLAEAVQASEADFGVAFDGDGDRIAVVTGSGRILRTDILMMLLARDVVSRNPGADVVYDVKCSRNLAQLISNLGGRPVLSRTGHAPMKEKMAETGALLGGEFSGHIFFGERWYGFDDGMYACARLAEIIAAHGISLDEMLADLPVAVSTPEILVPVPDEEKFELMDRFIKAAHFPEGKALTLDGLRMDFSDGWGLLRASNTSGALTARFEAADEMALESIMSRFRDQLAAVAPGLNIPF